MIPTVTPMAGRVGRPFLPDGASADPPLEGAAAPPPPGAAAGFGVTRALAPDTIRIGSPTPSEPDTSEPSGSNAIASPCFSLGSGTRTGSVLSAARRSPSGTAYRYASV